MVRMLPRLRWDRLNNPYAVNALSNLAIILLLLWVDLFDKTVVRFDSASDSFSVENSLTWVWVRIVVTVLLTLLILWWMTRPVQNAVLIMAEVPTYNLISLVLAKYVRDGILEVQDTHLSPLEREPDAASLDPGALDKLEDRCIYLCEKVQQALLDAMKNAGVTLDLPDDAVRVTLMMPYTLPDQRVFTGKVLRIIGTSVPPTQTLDIGFPIGEGFAGLCWQTKAPVLGGPLNEDSTRDGRYLVLPKEYWNDHQVFALASLPVLDPGRRQTLLAVLNVSTNREGILPRNPELATEVEAALYVACRAAAVEVRSILMKKS